jgi:hypothetical protein
MGARSLGRNTTSAFDVTVASSSPIARVAELPRRHAARRIRRHRRRPAEDVQIHETQGRRQRATRPGRPDDGAARIRVPPVRAWRVLSIWGQRKARRPAPCASPQRGQLDDCRYA